MLTVAHIWHIPTRGNGRKNQLSNATSSTNGSAGGIRHRQTPIERPPVETGRTDQSRSSINSTVRRQELAKTPGTAKPKS
jgi:hypothetical protein